jgi:hypothetical protein
LLLGRKKVEAREEPPKPLYYDPEKADAVSTKQYHFTKVAAAPDHMSTIHGSRGFIDIGSDATFSSKASLMYFDGNGSGGISSNEVTVLVSNWKKEASEAVIKQRTPAAAAAPAPTTAPITS